jgi:guanylate kinase
MQLAHEEIGHWQEFDHVVVNHDLDTAVAGVRSILHAARTATARLIGLKKFVARL